MERYAAQKTRPIVIAQVLASATATPYPAFPSGPTNGIVQFLGDFRGALIVSAVWKMANLTTFTAADCKVQTSEDGVVWHDIKAFTQKAADGTEKIDFEDTDPNFMRLVRVLIDMTGSPGTSTHDVEIQYVQLAQARGGLADGIPDRSN